VSLFQAAIGANISHSQHKKQEPLGPPSSQAGKNREKRRPIKEETREDNM